MKEMITAQKMYRDFIHHETTRDEPACNESAYDESACKGSAYDESACKGSVHDEPACNELACNQPDGSESALRLLMPAHLAAYREYLLEQEKSTATVEKYLREARAFAAFVEQQSDKKGKQQVIKELTLSYKQHLMEQHYAVRSINGKLAALNSLLTYLGWADCRVRSLRCQRQAYCSADKELTKAEYLRLLAASKQNPRLNLVIQTICATGIRVSELRYFTVEAVRQGEIQVSCKGKNRQILIPGKLRKRIIDYCKRKRLRTGPVFATGTGHPLDRSYIWAQMKKLCRAAGVDPSKVFPHNLRKLFARTFYRMEKDIAELADILGHSSIETTRIYIMTTGAEHRKKMERLGLIV